MSTSAAMTIRERTRSILDFLPETDIQKVYTFTMDLINKQEENVFKPITKKEVLEDIQQSKDDYSSGRYEDARKAMDDILSEIRA